MRTATRDERPPISHNKLIITGKALNYATQLLLQGNLADDGSFAVQCCRTLEARLAVGKGLLVPWSTAAPETTALLFDLKPGDEVIRRSSPCNLISPRRMPPCRITRTSLRASAAF
jgi:dTDP-4-amino-4,6-dideoxygalactose transaminase